MKRVWSRESPWKKHRLETTLAGHVEKFAFETRDGVGRCSSSTPIVMKMSMDDDDLQFLDDDDNPASNPTWSVLVVDDDLDIHETTEMALANFRFEGRMLQLLHAYNGKQSVEAVRDNEQPIQVILMDVVMDTNMDGLDAARQIREITRKSQHAGDLPYIVIRSGQAGDLVSEALILSNRDINEFLGKTSCTAAVLKDVIARGLQYARDHFNTKDQTPDSLT